MATITSICKYPLPTLSGSTISILAFLWLPFSVFAQKEIKECRVNNEHSVYALENGQMNGAYNSYHANGKKKAEGQFVHNTRIGLWTIWDSMGGMLHQRHYADDAYDFTVLYQKNKRADSFFVQTKGNLIRHADGYLALPEVTEKEIFFSTRNWRMIRNKEQNPALFDKDYFFNWLIENVLNEKMKTYVANNDKFWHKLTVEELKKKMDSLDVELVGFRLKETMYFTVNRQHAQTQILGLAPIVRSKKVKTADPEFPLFWIRVPDARKVLVQCPLPTSGFPSGIKTYDDLFFNRCFSSTIIKESNVYSKAIDDYQNETAARAISDQIDMNLIEVEHNMWDYSPKTYAKR
jgi:hypothetical protein